MAALLDGAGLHGRPDARVELAGSDIRGYRIDDLRRQVSQDTYMFYGTIAENLRIAKSEARDADTSIVLARGRVVEQGSHAELMARSGVYTQLVETQLAAAGKAARAA